MMSFFNYKMSSKRAQKGVYRNGRLFLLWDCNKTSQTNHIFTTFVAAKKFIGTLKTKIYKYMTSVSKIVYINKLDDLVNKYNNTCHRTTKMKPVDVKGNTYIDSSKEVNDKDP